MELEQKNLAGKSINRRRQQDEEREPNKETHKYGVGKGRKVCPWDDIQKGDSPGMKTSLIFW